MASTKSLTFVEEISWLWVHTVYIINSMRGTYLEASWIDSNESEGSLCLCKKKEKEMSIMLLLVANIQKPAVTLACSHLAKHLK